MEGNASDKNYEETIYSNNCDIKPNEVSTNTSLTNYGKDYLVIDHGEQLQQHYETSQRDLQNQVQMIRAELTTLREVVTGLVFILGPLLAGWTAVLLTRMFGYRSYETYAISVNIGMLAAVLLCDGPPFLNAFQRLFYHVEPPAGNLFPQEYVGKTNPSSSSESVHVTEPDVFDDVTESESENIPADSVENLRSAVDDVEDQEDSPEIE
ncbi:uncharacterized protein LOC133184621 [Saccostrea echinata]|uniref:uncharacterized protein LOC133184621 n=1 Tax=Saccostrea echinata TaxID=191078 RepID=UPI002A83D954|nr:uncharacterized protein LOC133184621 [Saccostrea echinata]